MTLQTYLEKGVTQISVKDGEAIAVNPYIKHSHLNGRDYRKWKQFELFRTANLIPCPAIPNGVYEIGELAEGRQLFDKDSNRWIDEDNAWLDLYENKPRTVLVLKDQPEEHKTKKPSEMKLTDFQKKLKKHIGGSSLQWKPAPFECEKCGSESEVLTKSKEDWNYYEDEEVRCANHPDCNLTGIITIVGDGCADVIWDEEDQPEEIDNNGQPLTYWGGKAEEKPEGETIRSAEEMEQIWENESEGRYPVLKHTKTTDSPYFGSKATFKHGCRFGYKHAQNRLSEYKAGLIATFQERLDHCRENYPSDYEAITELENTINTIKSSN